MFLIALIRRKQYNMKIIKRKKMNQLENEKLTEEFITYYKSLTEKEKFMLGATFNKKTGGK